MSESMTVDAGLVHPVLALRDYVVFPGMSAPLLVGRQKSVRALQAVSRDGSGILLLTQKDPAHDDPGPDDLYRMGTLAEISHILRLPDGSLKVVVEARARARILGYTDNQEYLEAAGEEVPSDGSDTNLELLARRLKRYFRRFARASKQVSDDVAENLNQITDVCTLVDTIAANLPISTGDRQELLETISIGKRIEKTLARIENELQVDAVERKIRGRVKKQMERSQKEYYLNEQIKAIQRELGEGEGGREELNELRERMEKLSLTPEARKKAELELKKLTMMAPISAEATVLRNYLDWLLSIPWGERSKKRIDLHEAERILEADHYGLEKVKERIIEYLAVQHRTGTVRGPVLCLVGPPGVGKTSLGQSVARATGREFIRIALGGVRDEAEIRGHRRTYVGAMPGKIIQAMRKAKTVNPLILFDEIDKMGVDFRGDPSSAMLEVLDPEQNGTFTDHFLEVEYDLSSVLFITTANMLSMSPPLLDRMEVLRLPGYTEEEKIEIARRHLVPKQLERHGLARGEFTLRKDALREIIRTYTREAGVRNLERDIAKLCRKSVTRIARTDSERIVVTRSRTGEFLGVPPYRYGIAETRNRVGIATGLAYTEHGGDLLSIEAVRLPGKGRMKATGKLGEVMKESVEASASYVRANSASFGIRPDVFGETDIHVHVPEGATPKDGPSAGIAIATTIVSLFTGIPIRRDVAMTGEVTLRGDVLAIGGLKEKLLAALRGGIGTVLIPGENEKYLVEVPENVKSGLDIIPVASVAEVLDIALDGKVEALARDEPVGFQVREHTVRAAAEGPQVTH